MSLPSLPSKIDASIGRVKLDRPSAFPRTPDLPYEVPAAEWERIKDALLQLAHVGLDGWEIADDFELVRETWSQATANNGTVTVLDANAAPASATGFGWVKLHTTSDAGSSASIKHKGELIRATHKPVFRARVKLPATFANASSFLGLKGDSAQSSAYFSVTSTGFWICDIGSLAGTGTQSVQTTTAAQSGEIYDVRIEVEPSIGVRFYVDDVLVQTLAQANAIPRATDKMTPDFQCMRSASTGGDLYLDWVDVRGIR